MPTGMGLCGAGRFGDMCTVVRRPASWCSDVGASFLNVLRVWFGGVLLQHRRERGVRGVDQGQLVVGFGLCREVTASTSLSDGGLVRRTPLIPPLPPSAG